MSGSSTAILTAFAMPAIGLPGDHTYVESDCGYVWRCFGRYQGGRSIAQNQGDSNIANCLSHPLGTAEVRYGLTGVCHQTANRILRPAGIIVSGAQGYMRSFKLFRDYGRAPWTGLTTCYQPGGATAAYVAADDQSVAPSTGKPMMMSTMQSKAPDISPSDFATPSMEDVRRRFDSCLTKPLSSGEVHALFEDMETVREEHERLSHAYAVGELTSAQFLAEVEQIMAKSAVVSKEILGPRRYYEVFGDDDGQPKSPIDPDTFLEEERRFRSQEQVLSY